MIICLVIETLTPKPKRTRLVVGGSALRRRNSRLPNTPLIRDLVQFFIKSELHEHGAYLVDSLIETNHMIKDCRECMSDLLLEEPFWTVRQETSLIEIMSCCIRQAATGEPLVGREPTRKNLLANEIEQVNDDRAKLTEHFIPTLPLSKYSANQDKMTNLVGVSQHFELDMYVSSRQEKA